jgi:hypothetical protein
MVMSVVVSIVAMLLLPFSTYLGRRKGRREGEPATPFPSR